MHSSRLDQDLKEALTRGGRIQALLDDLSPEKMDRLARDLKLPVGMQGLKHAGARGARAVAGVLARRQDEHASLRLLVIHWLDDRQGSPFCAPGSLAVPDWRMALHMLLLRLPDQRDRLPAGLRRAALELVAGTRNGMATEAQDAWRRWSAMVRARVDCENLRRTLNRADQDLRPLLNGLLAEERGGQTLDMAVSRWGTLGELKIALDRWWDQALARVDAVLEQLCLDLKTLDSPVQEPRELLTRVGLRGLEERLAEVFQELELFSLSRLRVDQLLRLPARLQPSLPDHCKVYLEQEAAALAQGMSGADARDPASRAPVLDVLGRILLDGEEPGDPERDILEEVLTAKFCRILYAGEVDLADESPGGDNQLPGADAVMHRREGTVPVQAPGPAPEQAPDEVEHSKGEDLAEEACEPVLTSEPRLDEKAQEEYTTRPSPGAPRERLPGGEMDAGELDLIELPPKQEPDGKAGDGEEDLSAPASEVVPEEEPGSTADAREGDLSVLAPEVKPEREGSEEVVSGEDSSCVPDLQVARDHAPAADIPSDAAVLQTPDPSLEDASSTVDGGPPEVGQLPAQSEGTGTEVEAPDEVAAAPQPQHPGDPPADDAVVGAVPVPPCSFDVRASAKEMAAQLLGRPQLAREELEELQAQLLIERQFVWVHWLADALNDHGVAPQVSRLLILGIQLQPGFNRSEAKLQALFEEVAFQLEDLEGKPAQALLLLAASVRPALMAPLTHPAYVLRQAGAALGKGIPPVMGLASQLADFAERMEPLSGEILRGLTDQATWDREQAALQKELDRWLEAAPHRNIKFAAATRVWQHWIHPHGELRKLLEDIRQGKLAERIARERLEGWLDIASFKRRLDRTDSMLRKEGRKPVRHGAQDAILRLVQDAAALGHRWLDHQASCPGRAGGQDGPGHHLMQELQSPVRKTLDALRSYQGEAHPRPLRAAALCLSEVLTELENRFQGSQAGRTAADPLQSLEAHLLFLPEVPRAPSPGDGDVLGRAIVCHLVRPLGVAGAVEGQLQRGRFDLARRLLDSATDAALDREPLEERIKEYQLRLTREAGEKMARVLDEVELHHLHGVIDESTRNRYSGEVQSLQNQLDSGPAALDLLREKADSILEEMRQSIPARRAEMLEHCGGLYAELKQAGLDIPSELKGQLASLIDTHDFSGAEELLARVRQGIQDEDVPLERVLHGGGKREYFQNLMQRADAIFEQALDLTSARNHVLDGSLSALPELARLDAERRAPLGEALEAWSKLDWKRMSPQDSRQPAALYTLLRWLGFQVSADAKLKLVHSQGPPFFWRQYEISATIDAPLPRFGSMADGRHTIVLVWGRLEPGDLARWMVSNTNSDHAVTVLHLNRVSGQTRRRFVQTLRRERRCALLLDTCLLLWLCSQDAADRTRALFNAGLAGAAYNPYTPEVGGGVPREMFFGREQDVDRIWDRAGPCVIFGGRQLGKSALLQQVIRKYHRPAQEQYVLYEGAKYDANLWDILRRRLERESLLKLREGVLSQTIKDAILKMLGEHPARRILVLLDECDNLLDMDSGRRFEQLVVLRDLMTETARRFKVVFTGLHNVQRFQRIANQPLAHFGEPLCIGPLPPRDAAKLVEEPLSALGYRFDPPSLVNRVLAFTNSHPSLLQLFCHDLVDAMLDPGTQPDGLAPPFVIDEETIARVYRRRDLRKKMKDRFEWTLDLDTRYRAIGYAFAGLELDPRWLEDGARGLTVREVLEYVRRETWPAGFEGMREDELAGLLEEMAGLGLLISGQGRRYRLRSPNVLRLIGGEDEVLQELLRFQEMPANPAPAILVVHRPIDKKDQPWVTSPMTLQQEHGAMNRDRGIDLIIGSAALYVDRTVSALSMLLTERKQNENIEFFQIDASSDIQSSLKEVRDYYSRREPIQGIHLEVRQKTATAEQYGELMELASLWMASKLTTLKRYIRLIFVIRPGTLLYLHRSGVMARMSGIETTHRVRLSRWTNAGLQHWFDDVDRLKPGKETFDQWMAESGGWPLLLMPRMRAFMEDGGRRDAGGEVSTIARTLCEASGLSIAREVERVFDVICQLADGDGQEMVDEEEVLSYSSDVGGIPEPVARAVLGYLKDLDLVISSDDRIRPEPVVRGIFGQSKKSVS